MNLAQDIYRISGTKKVLKGAQGESRWGSWKWNGDGWI